MTEEGAILIIVGSICGLLLAILIFLLVILCIRKRYRQNNEQEAIRQNNENWNESISMPQRTQNVTHCIDGQGQTDQHTDTVMQEQVYQVHESPALEPSAPPLPPEYYIEYT